MGLLIDGKWHDQWYDTKLSEGEFVRKAPQFRNWVTPDGAPGISGKGGFKAEHGRYHLYVSLACPWAHRTMIFRKLKGLENAISVSVVHPLMRENGWSFDQSFEGATGDTLFGHDFLHQIYTSAEGQYSGRVTVPVLWDKRHNTVVSNESSEIIRMFNSAFDAAGATGDDFYPERLRAEVDEINALVYENINNGVYRAGFATTQTAYEAAFQRLFSALDTLEARLSSQPFLVGDAQTEADWRLFTTLIRFDAVYVGHFKCNRKRIADYPALSAFLAKLYLVPGVAGTVSIPHIKHHYYASHESINPTGIVPQGPELGWSR